MISRILSLFFPLIALFFLVSCGETYTTPFPQDRIFAQQPLDKELLADQGAGFEQRGNYLSFDEGLQPKEGESFTEFENRVFNTLVVQEYDKQALAKQIKALNSQHEHTESQLKEAEKENKSLRLQLHALKEGLLKNLHQERPFRAYTVEKGDTLQKIAKRFYGSYTAWLAIYQFNQFYLGSPNVLEVGQKIWLPSFDKRPFVSDS